MRWRILPMSETCLLIEFGQVIDPYVNKLVRSAAECLMHDPLPGVVDVVPAFSSVAIHYKPECLKHDLLMPLAMPFERLTAEVEARLSKNLIQWSCPERLVKIPICYGGEFGPDLEEVASRCNMSVEEVVRLHTSSPAIIYMLGFAPGLPYAGGLDSRLSLPRRSTPRQLVAEGTVAIANNQTAIYSMTSPGGWNLIGRTPINLFDARSEPPSLLCPGDRLSFYQITEDEYDSILEQRQ